MTKTNMVGSESIQDAARCVEEQSRGNTDHTRGQKGGMKGPDMGDGDIAKVRKLGR